MIVATDCCGVVPLLPLLQTLFDIALLRKGPAHIPRSGVLLSMAIVLWLFASLTALVLIDRFDESEFVIDIFSALIAVACYSAVVIGARKGPRLVQTLTAILGCGALLTIIFVAAYTILQPILGAAPITLVAWLIILWSMSIKGHIIASAIDRHWYLGLAIAVAIFILQSVVNKLVVSGP